MLRSIEVEHLAGDHFEVAFGATMPAAQVAAVEPDHDRRGDCVDHRIWGARRTEPRNAFAHAAGPIAHRADVDGAADGQQLGEERGDFPERSQGCEFGGHVGKLWRNAAFERERRKTSRLIGKGVAAGATLEPPHAQRHVAEQGLKRHLPVPLAEQVRSAVPAASETLAHYRRLRPDDFRLDGGREPFSLAERQSERLEVRPALPLDPTNFDLGWRPAAKIGLELHPPYQLLHCSTPRTIAGA